MIGIRLNWNGGIEYKLLRNGASMNQGSRRRWRWSRGERADVPDRQSKHVEFENDRAEQAPHERCANGSAQEHGYPRLQLAHFARGDGQKRFVHLVYFDVVDLIYSDDVNVAANQRDHSSYGSGQQRPLPEGREPPGLFADRSRNASHRRENRASHGVRAQELDQRGQLRGLDTDARRARRDTPSHARRAWPRAGGRQATRTYARRERRAPPGQTLKRQTLGRRDEPQRGERTQQHR